MSFMKTSRIRIASGGRLELTVKPNERLIGPGHEVNSMSYLTYRNTQAPGLGSPTAVEAPSTARRSIHSTRTTTILHSRPGRNGGFTNTSRNESPRISAFQRQSSPVISFGFFRRSALSVSVAPSNV